MNRLLPEFKTLAEYRPLFRDGSVWRAGMRTICSRHGLDPHTLRFAPPGSNIVYWVEDGYLIKLFAPLWPGDAPKETAVLKALAGFCPFDIPQIAAEGELEGWPYLVLTRLGGQSLDSIWESLAPPARVQLAASLGGCIAALQALPVTSLYDGLPHWPGSWEMQVAGCLDRQLQSGVSSAWLDQIAAFLDAALPGLKTPCPAVILHADLNPEHLFCQETASGWKVTGMIDFADAMVGHPYYEWVRPGYTLHFEPVLLRAMFSAAGILPAQPDPAFNRSLLAFTFLHTFSNLPEMLEMFSPDPPADLDSLQSVLWGF